MAYENLKAAIKQAIKNNNNQEITGDLLQSTLLNIVNTIGADYKFLGFASPSTVPPTSEEGRLFYFASEVGEYINFPTSGENTWITIGEGLYMFTKEANSDFWKAECLIDIKQEFGDSEDKAISQNFFTKIVLSESNKLTAVDKAGGYIKNPTLPLVYGDFGSHAVYKDIPAGTTLKLKCTEKTGIGYFFILTNADSSKVLETTHTIVRKDLIHIFKSYNEITNLYISQHEQTEVVKVIKVNEAVSDLQNDVSVNIFKTVVIGIDGDSTTTEGSTGSGSSWPRFLVKKLGIQTKYNVAMGNAFTRDRTSKTSGVEYKPQWAPSVGNDWIDYWGLADPNYGTGESTYKSGTKEFDQATANNCLYAHIGYFIKQVNDGKYKEPNIFILAMGGINDTWGGGNISNIIGTVDDCIENISSWDSIERNTILRALMWAILKLKTTFKHCILYFKTPIQQSEDRHKYFYTIYKPLIELMNFLSVPILDSYAKLGIQRNLESFGNKENNLWTSDGTHPTQEGYKKEGLFIASELVNCKYQL